MLRKTRREMQDQPPVSKTDARYSRVTKNPGSEIRNLEGNLENPDEGKWHP